MLSLVVSSPEGYGGKAEVQGWIASPEAEWPGIVPASFEVYPLQRQRRRRRC